LVKVEQFFGVHFDVKILSTLIIRRNVESKYGRRLVDISVNRVLDTVQLTGAGYPDAAFSFGGDESLRGQ
jgi:hypothetical protein